MNRLSEWFWNAKIYYVDWSWYKAIRDFNAGQISSLLENAEKQMSVIFVEYTDGSKEILVEDQHSRHALEWPTPEWAAKIIKGIKYMWTSRWELDQLLSNSTTH